MSRRSLVRTRAIARAAIVAFACGQLVACFPTPPPQHAVWSPGLKVDIVGAPLPALGHRAATADGEPAAPGITWPGLLGGRFGTGNQRVRWAVGAYIGLALYGDASLAVRVGQLGRFHAAMAIEGGAGAAALTASATLAEMLAKESMEGAFGWWRARPLVSWGPREAGDGRTVLTVGGLYGELAGVREVGASLGLLVPARETSTSVVIDENEYQSSKSRLTTARVARGNGMGLDLYVLWHGEDPHPAVLLTLSGYFAGRQN